MTLDLVNHKNIGAYALLSITVAILAVIFINNLPNRARTESEILDSKTFEFKDSNLDRVVDPEIGVVCYHFKGADTLSCLPLDTRR